MRSLIEYLRRLLDYLCSKNTQTAILRQKPVTQTTSSKNYQFVNEIIENQEKPVVYFVEPKIHTDTKK